MENPNPNYSGMPMQPNLPNATTILVLGIVSLVMCGIIGLVCGIIALSLANKDLALYQAQPNAYTISSFNNLKSGKTCATIGIILSSVVFVFLIIYFIFIGTLFTTLFSRGMIH